MTSLLKFILSTCIVMNIMVGADIPNNGTTSRQKKLLPIFQIIQFQNTNCAATGSVKSGTCYTSEECKSKGGSSSGTCASGYGVCCVFNSNCGSTSSENCTYLTHSSTSVVSSSCIYKICKCSSDICRIRFDMTTFSISGPVVGTADVAITTSAAIGDCTTDQFSVTVPGGIGTPIICGFNTGQHIIVDASDQCHQAAFSLSSSTATRSWDIKVTQYKCSEEIGGPEGCLQYFTGTSGTISSFNFPTTSAAVTATATHLSNQCYNICIRRESGRCTICYVPNFADSIAGAIVSSQVAFGLTLSPDPAAKSAVGFMCTTDYILIPGAQDLVGPLKSLPTPVAATGGEGRICGRVLSSMADKALGDAYVVADPTIQISVCSQVAPFVITFKTDENEIETGDTDATTAETKTAPAGIIGFSLNYQQLAC